MIAHTRSSDFSAWFGSFGRVGSYVNHCSLPAQHVRIAADVLSSADCGGTEHFGFGGKSRAPA